MGVAASSNQILKIVTLVATLGTAVVVLRMCSDDPPVPVGTDGRLPLEAVAPGALGAEGDTEVETLRTLIGEVRRLRDDYAALEAENATLRDENAQLQRMEDRLADRLESDLSQAEQALLEQNQRVERQSEDTETLLQTLERRLAELAGAGFSGSTVEGTDLPVGLGFEDYMAPEPELIWVEPLDAPPATTSGERVFPERIGRLLTKVSGEPLDGEAALAPVPLYTVPRNSTLVGARGFTALVGRIPTSGQVIDPFPFKVLVGSENLAANGFVMPELFGMVFSGRAVGDWTLSCVRGEIYSVTYILDDGSIQSIPAGNVELDQNNRPIGWISDPFGVPCVAGERKTNAQSYLAQRIGLSAAASAAEAAAAAQTSTTVSGATGTSMSSVTGDIASFVRSRAIADGIDEVASWLDERQAQAFDAIYVPPDSELVVHVTRELRIDQDPTGRKVNHHAKPPIPSATRLD